MTQQTTSLDLPTNIDACEAEPIRTPEAIQPFGFLLVLDPDTLEVHRASANAAESLGLPMTDILGVSAERVLTASDETGTLFSADDLLEWLRHVDKSETLSLPQRIGAKGAPFQLIAHRTGPWMVLEGEPLQLDDVLRSDAAPHTRIHPTIQTALDRLQSAQSVEALCEIAAREVRRVTGLDRVKVYRFDADWHGLVVAEDREEAMPSYLGLAFPATDIPAQARALYREDRFRFIADADYDPSPILASPPSGDGASGGAPEPLDMSRSVLRSVSPIHLEYLRNMGVKASLSASIMHEGELWGLIACHHRDPIYLPYSTRAACGLIAQMLGLLLRAGMSEAELEARRRYLSVQRAMLDQLMTSSDLSEALTETEPSLIDLIEADGAVLYDAGRIHRVGRTPTDAQVADLVRWLGDLERAPYDSDDAPIFSETDVFSTDNLAGLYLPARKYSAVGSGVMAISLSRLRRYYVLWFRSEVTRTVTWAGNPSKAATAAPSATDAGGEVPRLHPRHSFEQWHELRRETSLPWQANESAAAAELKQLITEVVFVKTEQVARINASLARSNALLTQRSREMEEFAYVASHDLQEPLRKIRTFAGLLADEHSGDLSENANTYLDRLGSAAGRMSDLIRDLLAYSRVVTRARPFEPVNMQGIAETVRATFELAIRRLGGTFTIAGPLPTIEAEPKHLEELFAHLIGNAIKFTAPGDSPRIALRAEPVYDPRLFDEVEVDASDAPRGYRFIVEDEGVGFEPRFLDRIFVPFQKLASRGEHEGTGIGLALCKRIVQHHRGSITATSTPGEGSTFIVTLPRTQPIA